MVRCRRWMGWNEHLVDGQWPDGAASAPRGGKGLSARRIARLWSDAGNDSGREDRGAGDSRERRSGDSSRVSDRLQRGLPHDSPGGDDDSLQERRILVAL